MWHRRAQLACDSNQTHRDSINDRTSKVDDDNDQRNSDSIFCGRAEIDDDNDQEYRNPFNNTGGKTRSAGFVIVLERHEQAAGDAIKRNSDSDSIDTSTSSASLADSNQQGDRLTRLDEVSAQDDHDGNCSKTRPNGAHRGFNQAYSGWNEYTATCCTTNSIHRVKHQRRISQNSRN